ncbi:MAG: hypothetical protein NZ772_16110 [Cyanobacteria bacterium]|nr:hypothetical protein [Cyanobacteriota bacterium]
MQHDADLQKSLRDLMNAKPSASRNLDLVVEGMRNADRACQQMLAIEVWAIAKTVDNLFPGFWNRFMINRQQAVKQFLTMKHARRAENPPEQPLTEMMTNELPIDNLTSEDLGVDELLQDEFILNDDLTIIDLSDIDSDIVNGSVVG